LLYSRNADLGVLNSAGKLQSTGHDPFLKNSMLFSKPRLFPKKNDRGFAFLDRFLENTIVVLHFSIVFWKTRSWFCISRSFSGKHDRGFTFLDRFLENTIVVFAFLDRFLENTIVVLHFSIIF
jgi:hypothetical protein